MRVINDQIYFKILFFGTALAGKTTTLRWMYDQIIPEQMKMVHDIRSVNTSFGQTMLFDFVPVKMSESMTIRFFTATGQDYYAGTRKMLFQDIDGVFFVVDSQKAELEHNKEFVREFYRHIEAFSDKNSDIQVIVLYNKQDLEDIHSAKFLADALGMKKLPAYEVCAIDGRNMKLAFRRMIRFCMKKVENFQYSSCY